jgi:hypothetical protein
MVGCQLRPTPAQAAIALLDLVFQPVDPGNYSEFIRNDEVLPWKPNSA